MILLDKDEVNKETSKHTRNDLRSIREVNHMLVASTVCVQPPSMPG